MVSVPLFESVSCAAIIFCFGTTMGYCSFIYDTLGKAVATEGARHFSAVTVFSFFCLVFVFCGYFHVVLLYYGSHVGGTTVAELDVFSVENFV